MLVDDEQWCLTELSNFLTASCDAEIVGTHLSGRDALSCVEQKKPDIAFIDVLMPGMTGLELAKKLKAHLPELRIN